MNTTNANTSPPFISDFMSFPLWYHVLNIWYFATNIFCMFTMEKVNIALNVHRVWTWIIIYGLIGGLVEHTSPYIPACTITVEQEVILFRWPTIIPGVVSSIYLNLHPDIPIRLKFIVLMLAPVMFAMSRDFFNQDSAASLSWEPFHAKHVWQPHVIGPCMVAYLYYCTTFLKTNRRETTNKVL